MQKTNFGSLSVLQFDSFGKIQGLKHCITTKEGWKTGNKPRFSESDEYPWKDYRQELAKALNISFDQLYIPKQTHSDIVIVISETTDNDDLIGIDAMITNVKGVCLAVQTADCVPILLFDQEKKVIGAVHAGWRGTVEKLVEKTIKEMVNKYGCNPQDIKAGIGPSIYKHAYEIGTEVIEKVIEQFANYKSLLIPSMRDGKAFFDLWEANKILLTDNGVKPENIEILGMCSYELDHMFFSARRDGPDTGRMISCIMMN